jgi:phosphoribosylaminoimidazole carboxylase (NCAIR synthetase)
MNFCYYTSLGYDGAGAWRFYSGAKTACYKAGLDDVRLFLVEDSVHPFDLIWDSA